jgi:hypothetical protein
MVDPGFHIDCTWRVDHDDNVVRVALKEAHPLQQRYFETRLRNRALLGNGEDKLVTPLPGGNVVSITNIPIDGDILLAGVARDEHQRHVLIDRRGGCSFQVVILEPPRELSSIRQSLLLKRFERSDQVGEIGRPAAPADGNRSIEPASIGKTVRSLGSRSGVRTEDGHRPGFSKG